MTDDNVRGSERPRVRTSAEAGSDEFDRVLADLTDVEPSPDFRAKVMRAVETRLRRRSSSPRWERAQAWQLGFGAAALVVVAAVVWFATGGPGQDRNRADLGSGTISAPRGSLPDIALSAPAPPQAAPQLQPGTTEARPRAAARPAGRALQLRQRSNPIVPAIAAFTAESPFALPAIDVPPIAEPQPVTVDPLLVESDEIPLLELGPVVPPDIDVPRR